MDRQKDKQKDDQEKVKEQNIFLERLNINLLSD